MGPPTEVETAQLEALIQAVDDLRRRVAALEQRSLAPPVSAPDHTLGAPALATGDSTNILAALGRLLLGIAGAYLLRAITEATLLPQLAGTMAGLLYAMAWLVSAGRIASRNRLSVGVQALTSALIAGPLVWEAAVHFHSLPPAAAAAILALFIICGQIIAWRSNVDIVAGVAALAGSITALLLIVATLNPAPFATALVVAAAVIEYGAVRDRALGLRWIIAVASDFCAFLILYVATRPQGLPDGYAPISVQVVIGIPIALAVIYLASTVTRTLIRRLSIGGFEIGQVAVSIALAVGCGLRAGHGVGLAGALCLAAGLFGYVPALLAKSMPRRNFQAYAMFAILLISIGSLMSVPALIQTFFWLVLALAATAFGEHRRSNTFRMHGAFYFVMAAGASGLLVYSAQGMIGDSRQDWPPSVAAVFTISAAAIAYGLILRLRTFRLPAWTAPVSTAIMAALVCWGVAGFAAALLITTRWDAALVSTLRTSLVAAIAVTLAWFGRRRNLRELIWILYPWMIFGALRLVAEDFRQSRSMTLFLSLLLYGATLLALPRLLRRATPSRSDLS